MRLATLALVGALCALGVSAEAQTCGVLCAEDFWKTASQTQIVIEISKTDLKARDENGWTALMFAARFGAAESVKLLMEAGADLEARSEIGRTALMAAARNGTAE